MQEAIVHLKLKIERKLYCTLMFFLLYCHLLLTQLSGWWQFFFNSQRIKWPRSWNRKKTRQSRTPRTYNNNKNGLENHNHLPLFHFLFHFYLYFIFSITSIITLLSFIFYLSITYCTLKWIINYFLIKFYLFLHQISNYLRFFL